MKTIDQFMWAFQPHFRRALELAAEEKLGSIGVTVAPMVVLIGFKEDVGGHPICVEPEDVRITPDIFADSMAEGDAAYNSHEHGNMFISDRGLHERFHASLRDKCRAAAVAKSLNSHAEHALRHWFVGSSAQVGDYRVYPAIGVLRGKWDELPTLTCRKHDHRIEMDLSLQEAVILELLESSSFSLSISDQPQGLRWNDRDEVVRRALKSFVRNIVFFNGDFMGGALDDAMNSVAAQPYEGRTGVGTLLLAAEADSSLELEFESPFSLSETRALRKALEMTDSTLRLVTDGNVARGLGTLTDGYAPELESAFTLRVIGRGEWELVHDDVPLVAVKDGHASVPKARLDRSTFEDAVERLFGKGGNVERLWRLANAASEQAHGTMLVVHTDAAGEAARLSPPAMRLAAGPLTESTLLAVSAIDGAILVDPEGQCHAVGVILDGRAVEGLGDASRGARFNSAHRYLAEAKGQCLIIIVSEDGMLNLIPDLPRRVKRSYVEKVLAQVESLSQENPVDFQAFHRSEKHLRSLAFYFTLEQCERANNACERVEQFRESSFKSRDGLGGITRLGYESFKPDPRLDDTYFLPEDER